MPRREYGAPEQVDDPTPADYLAVITKAVFQSGMSWDVIEAKWDGFLEAFAGFDPETVAGFGPDDVERLAGERLNALRKHFKFLGDFGAYYLMYVVKQPVPPYEEARAIIDNRRR